MALSSKEVVTVALFLCGGAAKSVHTEDVALRVAEIAPGRFAWERYPDHIDKELVRIALRDAGRKDPLVVGTHSTGWMLTPTGLAFAQTHAGDGAAAPAQRATAQRDQAREAARLKATTAFAKFEAGELGEVTDDEVDAFFHINVYVRGHARERKLARIENELGSDPELGELVTALAARARERE